MNLRDYLRIKTAGMQKLSEDSDESKDQRKLRERLNSAGYDVAGPGYRYDPKTPDLYYDELPADFPGAIENISSPIRDDAFYSLVGSPGREGLLGPSEWQQRYGTRYIDEPEYFDRYGDALRMYTTPPGAPLDFKVNPGEPIRDRLRRTLELSQGMRDNAASNDLRYLQYLKSNRK